MNSDDNNKEITKQLQAFLAEQQKQGHTTDMSDLNHFISKVVNSQNSAPRDDFNGFSSEQMFHLINDPFGKNCPVQLRILSDDEINEIPFLKQALYLMRILEQKELKLTAQGYIPPKIVLELFEIGL